MDLTRRRLLGRAAVATGAALSGSLWRPGLVFAGRDGEAVFERRILGGERFGNHWHSGTIAPKRHFELVGIGPATDGSEMRARGLDGRWSEWIAVAAAHDHGPDARGAGSALSDPVWLGPSDAIQIRSRRPLRGARVLFVDPGTPASAARATRYVDSGFAGQPRIVARSTWATRSCRPRVPAVFGSVELAFVHHTVSSNHYRRSQSAAMVRSICLFHKYGNGWNDIGYNFVVDRYGQIFEARQGGIDEAIVGAQAGGYNTFSTGVALLGDYGGRGPSRPTFDALADLLAWKLALHGIEPTGRVSVRVTRAGAPYSRYRAGAHVKLNRISGHRDADTTACPGRAMYRQLPHLRRVVERRSGSLHRLTLASASSAPGSATVGGQLAAPDGPVAGVVVELQQHSTTAPPQTLATATTNADGSWTATVALSTSAQLRALYRGDAPAVSDNLTVAIPPQIGLAATTQQTIPGGVIEFDGTTQPVKPKVTLVIAQQQPDGSLTVLRSIRVNTNDDGSFSRSIGFSDPGQYQVIAHTAADAENALGTSPPLAITVF